MPSPVPTDEDISFVREVTGEISKTFIASLIDNLDDAEWSRALTLVDSWNEFPPGSVMQLVNGGREGVNDDDQEALGDIRRRMRLLLGLPEFRGSDITGQLQSMSVPVLWVW